MKPEEDLQLLPLEEARKRIILTPPWPKATDEELEAMGVILIHKRQGEQEQS